MCNNFRVPFRNWLRPNGLGARNGFMASGHRTIILVMLSLSSLLGSTCVLAQDKPANPSLLDDSLEDLMAIKIDTVYGASGFKQKVTEAPASVTILTSEETHK